jgi:hypothetical protein
MDPHGQQAFTILAGADLDYLAGRSIRNNSGAPVQ